MLGLDSNFTTFGQKQFAPGVTQQNKTVTAIPKLIMNIKRFVNSHKQQNTSATWTKINANVRAQIREKALGTASQRR